MGDGGYLDEHGRFWFCGRVAHRVLTAAGAMYTIPCEAIFNQHPAIFRSALVGVGPAGQAAAGDRGRALARPDARAARSTREQLLAELQPARRRQSVDAGHSRFPASPVVAGRHPAQRQDLSREAGRLGGQKAEVAVDVRTGHRRRRLSGPVHRRTIGGPRRSCAQPCPRRLSARLTPWASSACGPTCAIASAVRAACAGVDVVFHTAAVAGIWGAWKDYLRDQYAGHPARDRGCRQHGVPRLVYTSSPSVTFDGASARGVDESAPYPRTLAVPLSAHQGLGRASSVGGQWRRIGDLCAAAAPDLGAARPASHSPLDRPSRGRATAPRGRRHEPDRHGLRRKRGRSPSAGGRRPGDRLARRGSAYFISQGEPVNCWQWIDEILALAGLPPVQRSISLAAAWRVGRGVGSRVSACWALRREPPHDPLSGGAIGHVALLRHLARPARFGLRPRYRRPRECGGWRVTCTASRRPAGCSDSLLGHPTGALCGSCLSFANSKHNRCQEPAFARDSGPCHD